MTLPEIIEHLERHAKQDREFAAEISTIPGTRATEIIQYRKGRADGKDSAAHILREYLKGTP